MLLIRSRSIDPYWNLAAEDYFLDLGLSPEPTLLFWRAHDTVVVGRNQNPWRECCLRHLQDHEILLARRVSGGGTVYIDSGNLNYAFFCPRAVYRQDDVYQAVINGLRSIGVGVERLGKSSLSVNGLKFSGNAFCFRKEGVLQHGTLLVESDLDRLHSSLQPTELQIRTNAVVSEPVPVINLSAVNPAWTVDMVESAVCSGFEELYGSVKNELDCDDVDPVQMNTLHQQYCSDAWRLERTPRFSISIQHTFTWGQVQIDVDVVKGRMTNVCVQETNASMPCSVSDCLNGVPFSSMALASALVEMSSNDQIIELAEWFRSLGV